MRGSAVAITACVVVASTFVVATELRAAPAGWSDPINISNSDSQSDFPAIAADMAGGVHVVWTEDASYISYARLGRNMVPSPVDVLVTPGGGLAMQTEIAADEFGYLHVVWRGNGIMHSRAHVDGAGSAHGWSPPVVIAPSGNHPDIAIDKTGTIHVVFAEQVGPRSGIHHQYSQDGGSSWSDAIAIYSNAAPDRMVDKVRLAIGPDDVLHASWMEAAYPETYPPIGIRYARSTDVGASWSEVELVADGPFDDPGIAATANGEVHVVWSGTAAQRFKFHRWSSNAGVTWNPVWHHAGYGGLQGWPALSIDGSDNLHWSFVASGEGRPDSVYYSTWSGAWTGVEVLVDGFAELGQNPGNVSATVALGNELHVVVQNPLPEQLRRYQQDIFYLNGELKAESTRKSLVATATRPLATLTTVIATLQATSQPTIPRDVGRSGKRTRDWLSVLLPIGSAASVVGVFAFRRLWRSPS